MGPLRSASGALVEGLRSRGLGFAAMLGESMQSMQSMQTRRQWQTMAVRSGRDAARGEGAGSGRQAGQGKGKEVRRNTRWRERVEGRWSKELQAILGRTRTHSRGGSRRRFEQEKRKRRGRHGGRGRHLVIYPESSPLERGESSTCACKLLGALTCILYAPASPTGTKWGSIPHEAHCGPRRHDVTEVRGCIQYTRAYEMPWPAWSAS